MATVGHLKEEKTKVISPKNQDKPKDIDAIGTINGMVNKEARERLMAKLR